MDWVTYAVIATVAAGLAASLFRMPTFKGYSSLHSTFWINAVSLFFSLVFFALYKGDATLTVVSWLGLLWGVLFAFTTAQQKILLGRMETNTLLPVTSSLSNVLVVFVGIFIFSEQLSLIQYGAALLILLSVFLYSRKKGGLILDAHSIMFGMGIIISSAIGKVIQKVGSVNEVIVHFVTYQYIGATLCALLLVYLFERHTMKHLFEISNTWKVSLIAGFCMAIAAYAFCLALQTGPMTGVFPIAAAYTFIAALCGVWLYKEKLTTYKVTLMILTCLGVILMKLG